MPSRSHSKRPIAKTDTGIKSAGLSSSSRKLLTALTILCIMVAGYLFRDNFASRIMPPPARMQGETTQAYRYTRMISRGESIPRVDSLVMHPGGMVTSQNSIFEEYVAGLLHRITGGDFDDFIRFFCIVFPLLTIPLLYLWMHNTGYNRKSAILGSSLYAFILPALLRTRGESLYRETVALPLIVLLGCLIDISLHRSAEGQRKIRGAELGAGIVLFLALASWKVTPFVTTFLFLYLLLKHHRFHKVSLSLRVVLAVSALSASLFLPHLRHDAFWLSPTTVLALFLLVPVKKSRWWMPWLASTLAAAAVFIGPGATGHVGSVVLSKIRFLFRHPWNPMLLSSDARLFWVSGYTSPTPAQVLFLFGIPVMAAIPGIRAFLREKKGTLLFWFVPLSFAGYLFFERLHVFLAVAIIPVITLGTRKTALFACILVLIVAQSLFPAEIASVISELGLQFRDTSSMLGEREVDNLVTWSRRNTGDDQAFLSFWHISGLLSAYADRPVVTHTFFENQLNRETIIRFSKAVFQPEDTLLAMMRDHQSDLVVYQADFLLDGSYAGLLYLAGLNTVPGDAVALQMQYAEETLDSLHLVFQGPSTRVFSRTPHGSPVARSFLFEPRYAYLYSDYDEARGILSDPLAASGYFADCGIMETDPHMLSAALLLGVTYGGPQDATHSMLNDLIGMYINGCYSLDWIAEDVNTFMHWCGFIPELHLLLARLYSSEGRLDEAILEYQAVLSDDPGNREAGMELDAILNGNVR